MPSERSRSPGEKSDLSPILPTRMIDAGFGEGMNAANNLTLKLCQKGVLTKYPS